MTTPPEPAKDDLADLRRILRDLRDQPIPARLADQLQSLEERLGELDARLVETGEQRRLAALYSVSQSLGSSLNLSEVLQQVMDAVIALTNAERGFLMLHDPETDTLHLQAGRNIENRTLESRSMEISRSVVREVLESGESILTTNAQTDSRFAEQDSVILYALRSIMCTPLQAGGKNLGVIYVDNRAYIAGFDRADLHLLDTFAAQAAIRIENARLYTRTDETLGQRVSELETLSAIDRELNARLDLDHILEVVTRRAAGHMDCQVEVALEQGDPPSLVRVTGPETGSALPEGDPLVGEALETGLPALGGTGGGPRGVFPLALGGRVTGVLSVEKSSPWLEGESAFIQRLAARSAVAIDNARLYGAVQAANQAKSQFVSVVSHELRLPMTSIKGYTDLILQGTAGEVTAQQREFLEIVRKSVDRMGVLVSDLLDISRIETGRLKLDPAPIPLEAHIRQVLVDLEPRIRQKRQKLVVDIPEDLPGVYADPNRLIQVLANLVGNAWKYTPADGAIRVTACETDGFVRTEVRDTGIGISAEDQASLFRQFFRSEDSRVREQPGWGLGLNVTRNLVTLMGGEIGVESEAGSGSAFWFTLPVARPR